jgi:hypothetical protein
MARLRGHALLRVGQILLSRFCFQPEGAVSVMLLLVLNVSNDRGGDFRLDPGHALLGRTDKIQAGSILGVGHAYCSAPRRAREGGPSALRASSGGL